MRLSLCLTQASASPAGGVDGAEPLGDESLRAELSNPRRILAAFDQNTRWALCVALHRWWFVSDRVGGQAAKGTSAGAACGDVPRRNDVIAMPLTVARTAKQTQAHSAGRKPAVTAAGLPRWP